jgi:hypothetical protein
MVLGIYTFAADFEEVVYFSWLDFYTFGMNKFLAAIWGCQKPNCKNYYLKGLKNAFFSL